MAGHPSRLRDFDIDEIIKVANYFSKKFIPVFYIEKSFKNVLDFDLDCVTVDELVRVKGIGPKTARFFVMHSRRDQKVATLDVHILKWLREQGVERVPSQTPQNEVAYKRLEEKFLKLAKGLGKDPAELDLEIWKKKAKKDLTSCRA